MAGFTHILRLLTEKPRTNAELQHLCLDHSGGIARTLSKLLNDGRAIRIDGRAGRGRKAVYAIKGYHHEA